MVGLQGHPGDTLKGLWIRSCKGSGAFVGKIKVASLLMKFY